jgi:hypothetical protein
MTFAKEISGYKLDLVGVQEVRWDRGSTEPAGQYIHVSIERGMRIIFTYDNHIDSYDGTDC